MAKRRRSSLWSRRSKRKSVGDDAAAPPRARSASPRLEVHYPSSSFTPVDLGRVSLGGAQPDFIPMDELLLLVRPSPSSTVPPKTLSPEALSRLRQGSTSSASAPLPIQPSASASASASQGRPRPNKRRAPQSATESPSAALPTPPSPPPEDPSASKRSRKRKALASRSDKRRAPQAKATKASEPNGYIQNDDGDEPTGRVDPASDPERSISPMALPSPRLPITPASPSPREAFPSRVSFLDDPDDPNYEDSTRRRSVKLKGKGRASATPPPAQRKSARPRTSSNRLPILHYQQSGASQSQSDAGPSASARPAKRRRTERRQASSGKAADVPTLVDDPHQMDFEFQMLDLPDVTMVPWVSTESETGMSLYVPPGVQSLVDGMKSALQGAWSAHHQLEVRYNEEVKRRVEAESELLDERMRRNLAEACLRYNMEALPGMALQMPEMPVPLLLPAPGRIVQNPEDHGDDDDVPADYPDPVPVEVLTSAYIEETESPVKEAARVSVPTSPDKSGPFNRFWSFEDTMNRLLPTSPTVARSPPPLANLPLPPAEASSQTT